MESLEYQGWSNRETWATALHLGNDQGVYEAVRELTREEIEGHDISEEINAYYLGERISEWVQDSVLGYDNVSTNPHAYSMLLDIGSLYRVNWREIAESYLSEMKQEVSA
jgi:hypothetical protein